MKKVLVNTLAVFTLIALIAALGLLLRANDTHRGKITCEGLKVSYADDYRFVSEDDIKGYLNKYYGSYIGQVLDSVDLAKAEKIIDMQSAVLKSEVFTTYKKSEGGMLNVRLTQREPVLRFQNGEYGFYIDKTGYIFPLQPNFTAHVPVIDGEIPIKYDPEYKGEAQKEEDKAWLDSVMALMDYIARSKTWREAFVQISVRPGGDLVLVPREGREKIIFGNADNPADKFARLGRYYDSVKPGKGEDFYSTVNLKYKGQIICRK